MIPDAKRTTVDVSVSPEILNGPASVEAYPDGSVNVINICLFLLFYKYFYSLFYYPTQSPSLVHGFELLT